MVSPVLSTSGSHLTEIRDYKTGEPVFLQTPQILSQIDIPEDDDPFRWLSCESEVSIPNGTHALYLVYHGATKIQLKDICFN